MLLKLYPGIFLLALKMKSKETRERSSKEWIQIAVVDCCKSLKTKHSLAPIIIPHWTLELQKLLFANYTPSPP